MGISKVHGGLQLLQDVIRQERLVLSGLRMAELGNQYFRDDVLGTEVSAKLVFEAMGVEHTSFDLNGEDGAKSWDLSMIWLYPSVHNLFDVVTNFGTSEHVTKSQHACWQNIDYLCKPGGLMIHSIPEVGSWPRHGRWHYTLERVVRLASACEYRPCLLSRHEHIHEDGRLQHSLTLCFRKTKEDFVDEDVFRRIMFPKGELHY